jgi:hypothetical protein
MIRRGGYVGGKRIFRHLSRMCLALLITTFSLYPGQDKLFPAWFRATSLPYIPHVLFIGIMVLSMVRNRRSAARTSGASVPGKKDPQWVAMRGTLDGVA